LRIIIPGYYYIFFILSVLFAACEAPRTNPVDPMNSDNSDKATIEGVVQTLSLPFKPITKVMVYWKPDSAAGVVTETDSKGYFVIQNTDAASGKLVFEKEGFMSDTIVITWNSEKKIFKSINLNKIPVLDSISISTSIMNLSAGEYNSALDIAAKITDNDKDIDTVYVEIPGLFVKKGMVYNTTSGLYGTSILPKELKIDNLEEAVGYDFKIYVKDVFNKIFFVGTDKISRIIKDKAILVSPAGNNVTDSVPVFSWNKYQADYDFTYTLEIYTNDFARQLISHVPGIVPDSTVYRSKQPLEANSYNWVIWIVDKFNNRSMSVPSTFVVK
jgi:hypothetical protein